MASGCRNARSTHHLLLGWGECLSAGFQGPSLCCVPAEREQMFLIFFPMAEEMGQKNSSLERGVPKRDRPATNSCSSQGREESEHLIGIRRKAACAPSDRGLPAGPPTFPCLPNPDGSQEPRSLCRVGWGRAGRADWKGALHQTEGRAGLPSTLKGWTCLTFELQSLLDLLGQHLIARAGKAGARMSGEVTYPRPC